MKTSFVIFLKETMFPNIGHKITEWELVRFHKSVNTVYQLFNVITNEWYESTKAQMKQNIVYII